MERYIEGTLIGCDTLTLDGKHVMLGINEKSMFPPPFGAIQGSCFPSDRFDVAPVREYVFAVLDAVGFNDGASHTEIILSAEGPLLVEVNPRLVGAKIPRLLNLAFGRSVHRDLIDLHLAYRHPLRPIESPTVTQCPGGSWPNAPAPWPTSVCRRRPTDESSRWRY
ncbi:ATP-grasp domain-containing protein [Methylogaea oryzae]|uniref:ATP-grasp domain-containing protein n=1 Tax=Methylogaea oryzae TaxID=1295382 RepID=UPI0020D07DCC|nr:hypothetical protein [Methylogaea oryzae]